jgi:ABC-type nitrate/sulfonate/bicarbonate transport system substrate-binding protein
VRSHGYHSSVETFDKHASGAILLRERVGGRAAGSKTAPVPSKNLLQRKIISRKQRLARSQRRKLRLETTTVRIAQQPGICIAPQYVAAELLRAEGFTDVRYVDPAPRLAREAIARGEADFLMNTVFGWVTAIDAGDPITLLTGVHVGCFELFGNDAIRGISDLKGKSVGVPALGGGQQALSA